MTRTDRVTGLRRSVLARIVGPDLLQVLVLTVVVMMTVLVVALRPSVTDPALLSSLGMGVVALLFLLAGATGGASVGPEGLRWRLRIPVKASWSPRSPIEFREISYGRYLRPGPLSPPALLIRVRGPVQPTWLPLSTHVVAPAATRAPGTPDLDFARSVVEHARAHDVPVEVTSQRWAALLAGAGVVLTDAELQTDRRHRPTSRRTRVTGAVLLVLAVCAVALAATGWQLPDVGERIVLGVLGAVMLVLGLSLTFLVKPAAEE
ncbi:hypothetical protein [Nocardioides sp. Root140]|uniref:hypothetical protein n=1 Tax=Nocardioides sp. Root140 TaxID=1736460 RepID=UPI0012E34FD8|nr:hypothetical protein [Nocardioides sp. Root140]